MKRFALFVASAAAAFTFCGCSDNSLESRVPEDATVAFVYNNSRLLSGKFGEEIAQHRSANGIAGDSAVDQAVSRVLCYANVDLKKPQDSAFGGIVALKAPLTFAQIEKELHAVAALDSSVKVEKCKFSGRDALRFPIKNDLKVVLLFSDAKHLVFGTEQQAKRLLGKYARNRRMEKLLAKNGKENVLYGAFITPGVPNLPVEDGAFALDFGTKSAPCFALSIELSADSDKDAQRIAAQIGQFPALLMMMLADEPELSGAITEAFQSDASGKKVTCSLKIEGKAFDLAAGVVRKNVGEAMLSSKEAKAPDTAALPKDVPQTTSESSAPQPGAPAPAKP